MKAIKVSKKSTDIDNMLLKLEEQQLPVARLGECVVEIKYAGVNLSDVKAVLGLFPKAVWLRHTGRDFSGIIIDGSPELLGKEVWGTGGELGIERDGTHAPYLVIPSNGFSEKPPNVSMAEAAGIGVPFVTAYEGLQRAGLPKAGDWLLVFGGNGFVGQAATQIATALGAKVICVERSGQSYKGHATNKVATVNSQEQNVVEAVMQLTDGHGADVVYNSVGSACFTDAALSMAHGATQIFISDSAQQQVAFNIFNFYRNQHSFVGINTQELDVIDCADILNKLTPGFNDGTFRAFPVTDASIFSIDRASDAYQQTYRGSKENIILKFS